MTTKINYRNITNTGVTAGTYNSANVTVNAQGQITNISRSNIELKSVQNTDFNAESLSLYPCDTTLGGFTVFLPQTVNPGESIIIKDYSGTWQLNNLIIDPGAIKINGKAGLLKLFNKYSTTTFYYINSTVGWTSVSQSANTETIPIEYLVAGGGGGGGKRVGGGGGGGGLLEGHYTITSGYDYTVVIGAGGSAATLSNVNHITASNGGDSRFANFIGQGGGGGASAGFTQANNGKDGGSGGGSAADITFTVSQLGQNSHGIYNQGNQGATALIVAASGLTPFSAGGGGGGGAYSSGFNNIYGGAGGIGGRSTITGTSKFYCGGGGGGRVNAGTSALGGLGGGGRASQYGDNTAASGLPNSGGGGGGSSDNSSNQGNIPGNGGSGTVIIVYPSNYPNINTISSGLQVNSARFSASINGVILTVISMEYGTIVVDSLLIGTDILSDTKIVSRQTGTGGIGTYTISKTHNIGTTFLNTLGDKNTPDLLSRTGYKIYEFVVGSGIISW